MRNLLSIALFALLIACGGDGPAASSVPGGGDGKDDAGSGQQPIPPAPGEEPSPELTQTRTALQPINETVADLGLKMSALVQEVETSIQIGDSDRADAKLVELLALMEGEAAAKVSSGTRQGVLAALATDLDKHSKRDGAPSLKIVVHADACCGGSGACDGAMPGGTCYEAVLGDAIKSCAGSCEAAPGEQPAAGAQAAPVEGEAVPVDGEAVPAEGGAAPGEGEAAPGEGEAAPGEGEAAPVEGEAAPAEGEAAPAEGEAAPAE
jgi:hypothetical protein